MDGPLEMAFLPDDAEEAQHQADLEAFRQEAEEALRAALTRPLTPREVAAISWWGNLEVFPRREPPVLPRDGEPF